jgi:hypothetical protein
LNLAPTYPKLAAAQEKVAKMLLKYIYRRREHR